MALDDTLVGEICHIKGARPGSARYDAAQSPTDRHHRDNLILMCPTHHTVIDDDECSYPVERLLQIKRNHEASSAALSESDIALIAVSLEQNVSSVGQTGGLSAHTVHAENITVQAAQSSTNHLNTRQIQAVENLWQIVQRLSSEFSMVVFIDTILSAREMNNYFIGADDIPLMDSIFEFRDPETAIIKMANAGADSAARERPFVSQRLWAIYHVLQAVYGRTAFLLANSFKEECYKSWREDGGCDQLLRASLPAHVVDYLKTMESSGIRSALDQLEDLFLAEAGMRQVRSAAP